MDYHNEQVQQHLLADGTLAELIDWLMWNDPNGVYSHADSIAEGMDPLTLQEARDVMRDQLAR